jgi:hypothetical protein
VLALLAEVIENSPNEEWMASLRDQFRNQTEAVLGQTKTAQYSRT